MPRRHVSVAISIVVLLGAACSDDATKSASSPSPTSEATTEPAASPTSTTSGPTTTLKPAHSAIHTSGPIEGGNGQANRAIRDLAADSYAESEFFFDGRAQRYTLTGEYTKDGRWTASQAGDAPFTTRMIVRRPTDPAKFSGIVLVEWLNVSGGVDGDPDWGYTSDEIVRSGHVWVGVSAQALGVVGGKSVLGSDAKGIANTDPARYGSLVHPGDQHSFDIFSQAGIALTNHDGPAPLGNDLTPKKIIAIGESQSASFLTSYINGIHPLVRVYDGFLVHSRPGATPTFTQSPSSTAADRPTSIIRTDLTMPTLIFSTETDLTVLGNFKSRQDDSATVRTWEVAGTAHADSFLLDEVYGGASKAVTAACAGPLNSGPQHQVLKSALRHLVEWVTDGTLPPTSPRIGAHGDTSAKYGAVIDRDEHGNAIGGIRTPPVDAPIATLSGDPLEGGAGFCFLFGSTTAFTPEKLAALYPTHDSYVTAFTTSLDKAVADGFVLRDEADKMLAAAKASAIPA